MAVNLSAAQISHTDIGSTISNALANSGVDPCMVELEIIENVAMHNIESAIATLENLKSKQLAGACIHFCRIINKPVASHFLCAIPKH